MMGIPYFGTVYTPNIVFLNNSEDEKNEEYKFNVISSVVRMNINLYF